MPIPHGTGLDPAVLHAMRRWPDVPHAYGWLSLDARGRWRLHEDGRAGEGGPGEPIAHPGIVAFIGRNYAADPQGRWYFQNGPQRVYVRLDAAPYILRLAADGRSLETHTGLPAGDPREWWLDDAGNLHARAAPGPGRILDRDLAAVAAGLRTAAGLPLTEALAGLPELPAAPPPQRPRPLLELLDPAGRAVALYRCPAAELPARLGFDPDPRPGAAVR